VGSTFFGPSHATTLSFVLLIVFLVLRPQGLVGRKGFE
jgi:branched-chain amino acid transport system permease protein